MKRISTLKYLILLFICISCGQKSSIKQNNINSDKIEQTSESLNKKSKIDIEEIDEIKKKTQLLKNIFVTLAIIIILKKYGLALTIQTKQQKLDTKNNQNQYH